MRLNWLIFPMVALLFGGAALAWDWYSVLPPKAVANSQFVGSKTCAECHQAEHALWRGSDHDRAMEVASEKTVLGDFDDAAFTYQGVTTRFFRQGDKFMVNTEGPDGEHHDYEIKYTFGVRPLQQYMVQFPDGRVQVLRESWDVLNKKWFYLTPPDVTDERILPGDPFHWTGITQNWNTTCADCHSTNVHKNYNPVTNQYSTTFSEINVSCEECHGPGSVHVGLARSKSPFWDREIGYGLPDLKNKNLNVQIETCAKCHARRHQIHEDFRPGGQFLDHYEPFLLHEGIYHDNGQILDEVYEYGSFLQSKMHANHVRCSDCHDPHSLKLKFVGNQLCAQCHVPGKYDTPAHHHHTAGSPGAQCIECHMSARTYMGIDKRRDHSFRVPRPDLTVEFGTPNACNDCHTKENETPQWAADAVRKWFGDKRHDDPHWTPAFAAGRAAKPEGEKLLLDLLARRTTPTIVQATAIDLLANYPSEAAAKAQREALYSGDPLVRLSALRSMPTDDPSFVADAARLLDDPVRRIRVAAVERLIGVQLDMLTDAQRKAFESAMIEFRASQELSLDHAGGHRVLATLSRMYGQDVEAMQHLRSAIELEPYMSGARAELASLLGETPGNEAEIQRLREEEVELVERDARLSPSNASIFYQLGMLRYLLGEYDKAQAALESASRLAPQSYDFLMALALMHDKRYEISGDEEQFNLGVEALTKLHEMRPEDPRAQDILMQLLEKRRLKQGGEPGAAPQ